MSVTIGITNDDDDDDDDDGGDDDDDDDDDYARTLHLFLYPNTSRSDTNTVSNSTN